MSARTLSDLFKAKDVTDDELAEAVAACAEKPETGERTVGKVALDIAAAVEAHPYASEIMANEDAPEGQRRNAVRTAMLLATVKASK